MACGIQSQATAKGEKMTIVARLTALLTANSTQFESNLKRANSAMSRAKQSWNSDLNRAGRSFTSFDTHVRRSIGSIGDLKTQLGGIATAVAGALSVQKIIQYSDTWKQLEGRLKIIEGNMEDVAQAQESLFAIAQRTRQPLESVITLYTKLNTALGENKRQFYDVAGITETVALALAVTGEGAAQSSSAILQFSQAVSSDFKASAQEINSLLDSAPRLALALQQSLGDGTKSLKQMAEDGELSTERVLRALEPLAAQGREIRTEFSNIEVTVSQALTQLDNAFLKFIGQTELMKNGTSSLAGLITALADNFDTLARAVVAVAVVLGARLAQSVTASVLAFTLATARTAAFNYQLGVLAFGSRAASVAMVGLAGATSVLGSAIAFLGGPVGVALIGTLALMSQYTNAAKDAQLGLNTAVMNHRQAAMEYITASAERRKAIEDDTRANIENYKRELEAIEKIATALDNENALFRFSRNIGSKLGIDTSAEDVRQVANDVRKVINDLESDLASFGKTPAPVLGGGGGGNSDKAEKKLETIIENLKEESAQLELQTSLYGQKESAIDAASRALKVQQQIAAAGITLSKEQQAEIDKYLESIERQTELQEVQAEQQKELEERERNRKQAIDQLGSSFESAFEKAIVDGEKLGDVLDALGQDIIRLLTRLTITEPLISGLSSAFSGSGSGGGFFDKLFGGSFASGIDYVPQDMYAKIHRGERVVTAAENRSGMGGDVTVIIQNNNGSQVSQSSRSTESGGTELTVMIDQAVAENITRKGSRTNQALNAQLNRSLVRK